MVLGLVGIVGAASAYPYFYINAKSGLHVSETYSKINSNRRIQVLSQDDKDFLNRVKKDATPPRF